jgi:hypothetical protein
MIRSLSGGRFSLPNFQEDFYVEHDYTLSYIHRRDVCRRCADVPFADGKAGGRRI